MNETTPISPIKAIRLKCLDCCCGSSNAVKQCPCSDCPLYPFRFGKNPFRANRELTAEQRAAAAERLKKARERLGSTEKGQAHDGQKIL